MVTDPQHDGHEHAEHDHGSGGHGDGHDGHGHSGGVLGTIRALVAPHSHDTADSIDDALTSSADGVRALKVSLAVLGATAVVQALVFAWSGSVGLLADTIHNFSDALTALPLGLAFWLGRRPANRRYTYGYGRSEDLAGVFIVVMIALSSIVAAVEAVNRLLHPHAVHDLLLVGVAGGLGFVGNEIAARFRITTGRRIGSAALVADGLHARTDGFTSLAVVFGAIGVGAGWAAADPIVGALISVAILRVLGRAARDIYRRLMDSVDPGLVSAAETRLGAIAGVRHVDLVRLRWIGHELHADAEITLDPEISLAAAHDIAEDARHDLLHGIRRLTDVIIHTSPAPSGTTDPHERTAHHPRRNVDPPPP
ncbi:MAG: cation diffusion facilitator family transporter [Acidimicrobiales bacterium]